MAIFEWVRGAGRVFCGVLSLAVALAPASGSAAAGVFAARVEAPDHAPVLDAVVSLVPLPVAQGAHPSSPQAGRPKATMDQIGLAFVPHVLAVATGTVVDFPNSDQVRHSIYSFSAAKRFEVKLYRGFEAPPISFDEPGLVVLGCNIHDHMLGFIYVLDTPHFAISDEAGAVEIRDLPPGRYRLELRHPRIDTSLVLEREIELPAESSLTLPLGENPPPRPAPRQDVDPLQSLFGGSPR